MKNRDLDDVFKGFYKLEGGDDYFLGSRCRNMGSFNIVNNDTPLVVYAFGITWYKLKTGRIISKLEIFSDSYHAIDDNKQLFEALAKADGMRPYEFRKLLLNLGYIDLTKRLIGG